MSISGALLAQNMQADHYEVIPKSWLTPNGNLNRSAGAQDPDAFIFPSAAVPNGPSGVSEFDNFFSQSSHFPETDVQKLDWPKDNPRVRLTVTRTQLRVDITYVPAEIERLDLRSFLALQRYFRKRLCDKGTV